MQGILPSHAAHPKPPHRSTFRLRRYILVLVLIGIGLLYVLRSHRGDNTSEEFFPQTSHEEWDLMEEPGEHEHVHEDEYETADPLDNIRGLVYYTATRPEESLPDVSMVSVTDPGVLANTVGVKTSEWKKLVREMEKESPVVVFSKTYCPYSRRAKELLASYALHPPPRIIEVDIRDDSGLIKALLQHLTHRATFPNILVDSVSIGGSDELQALHSSGQLRSILEKAGVSINTAASGTQA